MRQMSPVEQAVAAQRACGSAETKLLRVPRAGHNDLRLVARKDYYGELRLLCERVVTGVPAGEVEAPGFMGALRDFFSGSAGRPKL